MKRSRQTLTTEGGPVVVSEKTLRALLAIRREKLLPALFGMVTIARTNFESMADVLASAPAWLIVREDDPGQPLPDRVAMATASEAATLRLALGIGASLVLLDGPIKEKAKLSFIRSEGTVSLLVTAYREGHLSAVQPMVKALAALGHGDVLPRPEMLEALWKALRQMEGEC